MIIPLGVPKRGWSFPQTCPRDDGPLSMPKRGCTFSWSSHGHVQGRMVIPFGMPKG